MIPILQSKIASVSNPLIKINIVREFLQILVLKSIADRGYFTNLVFLGGTALRIIHQIRRYSEDLDFSLLSSAWYDGQIMVQQIQTDLKQRWFSVDVRFKSNTVQSTFFGFDTILQELGLSMISGHKLSIKLEVDTNPPKGTQTETTVINDIVLFAVRHCNLPSLMAGKLHAIIFRPYTKGRDWYDLLRYLTKWVRPNEELFAHLCAQSGYEYTQGTRSMLVREKIVSLDYHTIITDLNPFIMDPTELILLKSEIFLSLLSKS